MKYFAFSFLMSLLMGFTGCPDSPDSGRKCPQFQPGDDPFGNAPAYCPESP